MTKKVINVKVTPEMKKKIDIYCVMHDIPLWKLMTQIIEAFFDDSDSQEYGQTTNIEPSENNQG